MFAKLNNSLFFLFAKLCLQKEKIPLPIEKLAWRILGSYCSFNQP